MWVYFYPFIFWKNISINLENILSKENMAYREKNSKTWRLRSEKITNSHITGNTQDSH